MGALPVDDVLADLAQRLRAGRAVLVLGPRLDGRPLTDVLAALLTHVPAGDPELAAARELLASRPLWAASWLRAKLGARFGALLGEVVGAGAPGEAMRALLALPFRVLIAARWDDGPLEAALAGQSTPIPVFTPADGEARRAWRRERCLFRLFGAPERDPTLVFGETDVARTLAAGELDLVVDLWTTHTFLFVGFAPGDPELALLLERALAGHRDVERRHYACLPGVAGLERELLRKAHRVHATPDDPLALAHALAERIARLPAVEPAAEEERDLMALRRRGQHERVASLVFGQLEGETSPARRRELLLYLVDMYEKELEEPDHAFAILQTAHTEQPSERDWEVFARLAAATGCWPELLDFRAERAAAEPDAERRAAAWVEVGKQAAAHGDGVRAAGAYGRALDAIPGLREAALALEAVVRAQGDFVELARLLEERAERARAEERVVLVRELAELREGRLGDRPGAIRWYEELRAERPGDAGALAALDRLYGQEGAFRAQVGVLGALARVTTDQREKAALYHRMAQICEQRLGVPDEAEQCFESLLATDPRDTEAVRALARLYGADGQWSAAVEVLSGHVDEVPAGDRGALHLEIARVHEQHLGALAAAQRHYREAAVRLDEPLPALRALARVCEAQHDDEATLQVMLQLASGESDAGARADWGRRAAELVLRHRGDARLAEELLGHALAESPAHIASLEAMAAVRERAGDRVRAASLLGEAAAQQKGVARAELLRQVAALRESLDDGEAAAVALREVVALDPREEDLVHLDRLLAAAGRDEERMPVLEQLVRADDDPMLVTARTLTLARLAQNLGRAEQAALLYDRVLAAEPDHVEANRARAEIFVEAEAWAEARARLERAATAPDLSPRELVKVASRLALCALRLGDRTAALVHLSRALGLDATHRPSLLLKLELADSSPEARIEARRAFLAGATDAERIRLLIEIGDLHLRELDAPPEALAAYAEAIALAPDDRAIVRKVLDVHLEQKAWADAARTLDRLVVLETDPRVRARYRTSLALISDDELGRRDASLVQLQAALVDDPMHKRAAERLERKLTEVGRYQALADLHLAVLSRLGPAADDGKNPERARRWLALADLHAGQLGQPGDAVVAMEVALQLAPDTPGGRRALIELYARAGAPYAERALAAIDRLLAADHGDKDAYRLLVRLAGEHGRPERARAASAALAALDGGVPEPAGRPGGTGQSLDQTCWKLLAHADLDRVLSMLFGALAPVLLSRCAQPLRQLGVHARDRIDLDARTGAGRMVRYALDGLGLGAIETYACTGQRELVRIASLLTPQGAHPVLLLGKPLQGEDMFLAERIFEVARHAAQLVGGGLVRWLVPRPEPLAQLIDAAIGLAGGESGKPGVHAAAVWARTGLGQALTPTEMEQVAILGQRMAGRRQSGEQAVKTWLGAVELTAARAAYALAGDLGAALRRLDADAAAGAIMPHKQRVLDLVWASASEDMMTVRRHLAGDVRAAATG